MPTVLEIANYLHGLVDILSPSYAKDIVNQAREDLYSEREWGFLWTEGVLRVPALISAGTVSVTKYSREITLSVATKAIVDALSLDDIEFIGRQIKIVGTDIEYTIVSYDNATGIIQIDEMYLDDTNPLANYQIYKRFFYPPEFTKADGSKIIDFARFEAIVDVKNSWQMHTKLSNSWLNSRDVGRFSEGEPYAFIPHREKLIAEDSDESVMTYELYPILKDNKDRVYKVLYIRKGYNLESNERFPNVFSKSLIIAASEISMYKWCDANKGKFPSLQKTNWHNLIATVMMKSNPKGYYPLLDKAEKRDEELFPQALQGSYSSYPMASFGCEAFMDAGYYGADETLFTSDGVGRFRF